MAAEEETLRRGWRRRNHHFDAGSMGIHRFAGLAVVFGGTDPATKGNPDHQRCREPVVAAIAEATDVADDLVVCRIGKTEELDLGNRAQTGNRHPEGGTDDSPIRRPGCR